MHGLKNIDFEAWDAQENKSILLEGVNIADYLYSELFDDSIQFSIPLYQKIYNEFGEFLLKHELPTLDYFIQHTEDQIRTLAINMVSETLKYPLSDMKWYSARGIHTVIDHDNNPSKVLLLSIKNLKLRKIELVMKDLFNQMSMLPEDEQMILQPQIKKYTEIRRELIGKSGTVIFRYS